MNVYKRVIGIDVSMDRLDIADSNSKITSQVENTTAAIKSQIVKKIKDAKSTLVVCEATGGLEYLLVDMLHDAGVNVAVANPARVRDFANAHGFLEKSDTIDAKVLLLFGQQVDVSLARVRTTQERSFIALSRRRTQLLQLISQESNRLRQCHDSAMHELISDMVQSLKKQLKTVDSSIEEALAERAKTDPKIEVILSVPAVGIVMTATLVAEVPELGSLSRTKIAKLIGVAPIIKQSGKTEKKRRARGGRGNVRRVLYMSALVATKKNPLINRFYIRLLKQGKPKKLALVACMRKLLTMINDMVRNNEKWNPDRKSVAGTTIS